MSSRRVWLEAPDHDAIDGLGDVRVKRSRRRGGVLHAGHQVGDRALRAGVSATEQHVIEHQAEGVDVSPMIDRLATRLLGGHVLHGADHGTGHRRAESGRAASGQSRDAEIHDQRMVLLVDHDVGRLEIAMHDTGLVSRHKPRGDLPGDSQGSRQRQASLLPQDRREVGSLDVRHRDVLDAVDLAEIVNADDVLVSDLARQEEFALEAPLEFVRRVEILHRLGANDLDRDGDLQHLVPGLIDGPHSACAEQALDVVPAAEVLTDLKRTTGRKGTGDPRSRSRDVRITRRPRATRGRAGRQSSTGAQTCDICARVGRGRRRGEDAGGNWRIIVDRHRLSAGGAAARRSARSCAAMGAGVLIWHRCLGVIPARIISEYSAAAERKLAQPFGGATGPLVSAQDMLLHKGRPSARRQRRVGSWDWVRTCR